MSKFTRRNLTQGLVALGAMAAAPSAFSQAISEGARRDYGRVFRSRGLPSARGSGASGATMQELRQLLALQNQRVILPSSRSAITELMARPLGGPVVPSELSKELGTLKAWHDRALLATALDHDDNQVPGLTDTFAEQFGPTRTSRALAMVHLAMFEAVNVITQRFESYQNIQAAALRELRAQPSEIDRDKASIDAAIAEAAAAVLTELYPNKRFMFAAGLQQSLLGVGGPAPVRQFGQLIGQTVAKQVLALRQVDGAEREDILTAKLETSDPLAWRNDPIVPLDEALGSTWHLVKPFALESAEQFRPKPPPALGSAEFIAAYKEVKRLGGDPSAERGGARRPTLTERVGKFDEEPFDGTNQSFVGVFWAYDATPGLCAPPRLYNMVATSIALQEKPITKVDEFARYLALVNIAMADAAIAAWEGKYYYLFGRPVTVIRSVAADTTTEGALDDQWTPFGAPVSNGEGRVRNLTPNFPTYPSGHATFGGALFEVLRRYHNVETEGSSDPLAFNFVSDEYNGKNRQPGEDEPRPRAERSYKSLAEAEQENGRSRVYLGIHFQFDSDVGIEQGNKVGKLVMDTILKPKA